MDTEIVYIYFTSSAMASGTIFNVVGKNGSFAKDAILMELARNQFCINRKEIRNIHATSYKDDLHIFLFRYFTLY